MTDKKFTKIEEIAQHNKPGDQWIVIKDKVYNVSNFKHPGGQEVMTAHVGTDATKEFEEIGHS